MNFLKAVHGLSRGLCTGDFIPEHTVDTEVHGDGAGVVIVLLINTKVCVLASTDGTVEASNFRAICEDQDSGLQPQPMERLRHLRSQGGDDLSQKL